MHSVKLDELLQAFETAAIWRDKVSNLSPIDPWRSHAEEQYQNAKAALEAYSSKQ